MLLDENNYDCTARSAPKHEALSHKAVRTVHNLFHPHHKIFYIAPLVMACKAPDMVTVTVSTDAPHIPGIAPGPGDDIPAGYSGGGGGYYSGFDSPGAYGQGYELIGVAGGGYNNLPHASVPEPSALWLLLAGMIAVRGIMAYKQWRGTYGKRDRRDMHTH